MLSGAEWRWNASEERESGQSASEAKCREQNISSTRQGEGSAQTQVAPLTHFQLSFPPFFFVSLSSGPTLTNNELTADPFWSRFRSLAETDVTINNIRSQLVHLEIYIHQEAPRHVLGK